MLHIGNDPSCLLFHIARNKTYSVTPKPEQNRKLLYFSICQDELRHTCVMRREVKLDWKVQAFQSNKESWAPWWAWIMGADLPPQTCEKHHKAGCLALREGPFCLSAGSELRGRLELKQPPVICTHHASTSIWEYLHVLFVVRRSKQRRSIWADFMTHFSKFAEGDFKRPVKAVPQHAGPPH